jgi:uncharacterized protein YjbI with pentapeptide repeats
VRSTARRFARPPRRRRPLVQTLTIVTAVVITLFIVLIWHPEPLTGSLSTLSRNQQETVVGATRGLLLQFATGVLAAGALIFTSRNYVLSREGHVTERYTQAIEQLGSERRDVRTGAIFALERIMLDSPRDHPTIVEVLTAYVREHSPAARDLQATASASSPDGATTSVEARLATDVQAVLTVLGRRPAERDEQGPLDLRETDLRGADLEGANLRDADLARADLRDADLKGADLRGADLSEAILASRYVNDRMVGSTNLFGADLRETNLDRVDARDANLSYTKLGNAYLAGANLVGVEFLFAELPDAYLRGADLTGALFVGADLTRADLMNAKRADGSLTEEQQASLAKYPDGLIPIRLPPQRRFRERTQAAFEEAVRKTKRLPSNGRAR